MSVRICPICGKEFSLPHKNTAKYCSSECRTQSRLLKKKPNCICRICGKEFYLKPSHIRGEKHCCSRDCCNIYRKSLMSGAGNHQYGLKGEKNASFLGLITTKKNVRLVDKWIYIPKHPYANRYGRIKLHTYIVEQNHNLYSDKYFDLVNGIVVLNKKYMVHHIDGNHNNNNLHNLMIVTRSEHSTIHNMLRRFGGKHLSHKEMAVFQLGLLKCVDYGKISYKMNNE